MRHLVLSALLVSSGCAAKPLSDYPEQYRRALLSTPATNIDAADVDRFVALFDGFSERDLPRTIDALYAEELFFSDALTIARDRKGVLEHFERLQRSGTRIELTVHDTLIAGGDAYVIWSMNAEFTPFVRKTSSNTLGMTHLRFDGNGKIVLHQDFWDTGLGFYANVPIVGAMVRAVGRSFARSAE